MSLAERLSEVRRTATEIALTAGQLEQLFFRLGSLEVAP